MPYRIAGIDAHKKMLAVVVADVEIDAAFARCLPPPLRVSDLEALLQVGASSGRPRAEARPDRFG